MDDMKPKIVAKSSAFGEIDVINPKPLPGCCQYDLKSQVLINVPIDKCWKELTDLKNYDKWNPFQKHVEADLTKLDSDYKMKVNFICFTQDVTEKIDCFDEKQHVIMYGNNNNFVVSERIQVLIPQGDSTLYISHNLNGGWSAAFSYYITSCLVQHQFDTQVLAFKKYVEDKCK